MLNNWLTWCRLCATEDGIEIEEHWKLDNYQYLSKIMSQNLDLRVIHFDNMFRICTTCSNFMKMLKRFAEQCAKADQMFQELMSKEINTELEENFVIALKRKFGLSDYVNHDFACYQKSNVDQSTDTFDLEEANECKVDPDMVNSVFEEMLNGDPNDYSQIKSNTSTLLVDMSGPIRNKIDYDIDSNELDCKKLELDGIYRCDECGKVYSSQKGVRFHKSQQHSSNGLQKCMKCPKVFKNVKALQYHEKVHTPCEERRIHPCNYCGKTFMRPDTVKSHISQVHKADRGFVCDECGKGCKTKGELKSHKLTHTSERPYKCDHCSKSYKSLPQLKNHTHVHTEEKYPCNECDAEFNTLKSLRHHQAVHADRIYTCNLCEKGFKRARDLKYHLIWHSGCKPYTCQYCSKTFTNSSNCRTHQKRAHPVQLADAVASGKNITVYTQIPRLEFFNSQFTTKTTKSTRNNSNNNIMIETDSKTS